MISEISKLSSVKYLPWWNSQVLLGCIRGSRTLSTSKADIAIMNSAKILYFSGEIPQCGPDGDQRALFRKLKLLSKERDHTTLASLLECVTLGLKDEIRRLSRPQRDLIPSFESVLDLTDHVVKLRKTRLGGAIERVLVLVVQLGSFVA